MEMLSIFALIILIILFACAIGAWVFLAVLPGKIAADRGHRQADSVRICGYWGALTLGLLMPIAFIWAYWNFGQETANNEAEAAQ